MTTTGVKVTFDRCGRSGWRDGFEVLIDVEGTVEHDEFMQRLAEALYRRIDPKLGSRFFDVDAYADPEDIEQGTFSIGWGRYGGGQWAVAVEVNP